MLRHSQKHLNFRIHFARASPQPNQWALQVLTANKGPNAEYVEFYLHPNYVMCKLLYKQISLVKEGPKRWHYTISSGDIQSENRKWRLYGVTQAAPESNRDLQHNCYFLLYIRSHDLTMKMSRSWEANSGTTCREIPRLLRNYLRFITMFTTPVISQMNEHSLRWNMFQYFQYYLANYI
jgi:hypothetical protein